MSIPLFPCRASPVLLWLQYMGLLLKKSRRREMNKEVEKAFWKEHRDDYERVRRWRRPEIDPRSVWKLLPILILWRK